MEWLLSLPIWAYALYGVWGYIQSILIYSLLVKNMNPFEDGMSIISFTILIVLGVIFWPIVLLVVVFDFSGRLIGKL